MISCLQFANAQSTINRKNSKEFYMQCRLLVLHICIISLLSLMPPLMASQQPEKFPTLTALQREYYKTAARSLLLPEQLASHGLLSEEKCLRVRNWIDAHWRYYIRNNPNFSKA